ncbi:ribosome assembly protein 4 : WD-40 repeat protein OS=Lyngbya sp. (strain PCC 8106) GN=L8106_17667 PE=4 SV=1: WD40: WD40: WD40: WD40 [Gemmataceae bacterium]|nr:ribosome assembly protein 4 : WD-40 repeat protein OS=Lyngbya sp. (strain PCC 8106) GN=L8106_17667 PE=4 SV=1: WD40: WD40: WD40: WD40 [Gemmataceae bacterium]VTU00459.1 ribosome assembly protein 4 : WD-40 repeat protein OS=Lyngbya sp. (strain PCC 8106) GN=L8106_17667 PE=4 SV=1: WD40: WD40: WD40: WD40 [Gemmataceae bacterium]
MQTLAIGKKKRIYAVAFSPSGESLAAVCGDLFVRTWDLATGTVRHSAPTVETSSGFDLVYLDENRLVFSGTDLRIWDTAADQWHTISRGSPWGRRLKVSPGGEYLAEVDQTRSTDWTAGGGLVLRTTTDWELLPPVPDGSHTTGGVAFSRDGQLIATGHMASVGQRVRTIGMFGAGAMEYTTNDYDYLVRVRTMPNGVVVRTITGWQQAVAHLAFSPDGRYLAGTAGPRLRIWDLEANREVALHKRGTKHFQGLSFTADGRFLATVSNDETVRIWDARTWAEHTTFTWQIGRLLNIAFAPDGLRAAAGSDKGQIVIWDAE